MDKNNKLLTAATRIFARKGYQNTSIDEIVAEASVAKGTFYNYFRSKEDIFLAIIADGTDRLSQKMIDESNKYSDPTEKVKAIISSQYKFFRQNLDICRVMLSEIWRLESRWKQKYADKRDQFIQAMEQAITVGQKLDVFDKKIDIKTASIAIFGTIAISALDCLASNEKLSNDTVNMVTEITLNGLTAKKSN